MKNKELNRSQINSYVKAMLPSIVRGKLESKNNILSLNLKWKNFPRTVMQSNLLLRFFSEGVFEKVEYDAIMSQIKTKAKEGITRFGKKECDYLMEKFELRDNYRKQFEDKNFMYKVKYEYERKIDYITLTKNLDFYFYDEIKISLPYLYTFWILLVNQTFTHKNFNEIMEVTESLIMHVKQLFFTKDMLENILQQTKHFGNPASFFVFYYHFNYFLSLIKTIGDNLSWILNLYLDLHLRHNYIELDGQHFKDAIRKFRHYYNAIYYHKYYANFTKINQFRNVTQHRHTIRSMRVVLNWTGENKILIPKDPDVQISKRLRVVKKMPKNVHVKLAENKNETILTGPHDYTIIRESDLLDYDDPIAFCNAHTDGITGFVENVISRIINDITKKKIGNVSKFYSKVSVASIRLFGEIKLGSYVMIEGHTSSIKQKINELWVDDKKVNNANTGVITIKVDAKARPNDTVYRIPKIDTSTYQSDLFR